MSTQASIWREKSNGKFNGISIHSDGYLNNVGFILETFIDTPKKLTELMNVTKEYNNPHLSSFFAPQLYKNKNEANEMLEMYRNQTNLGYALVYLPLSKIYVSVIDYRNKEVNENFKKYRDVDDIFWFGYDYFQKPSGKWFVNVNLNIDSEHFEAIISMSNIIKLLKKGIINEEGKINRNKIFSKDMVKVLMLDTNTHKEKANDILLKKAIKLSDDKLGYNIPCYRELSVEEILKLTNIAIKYDINFKVFDENTIRRIASKDTKYILKTAYINKLIDLDSKIFNETNMLTLISKLSLEELERLHDNIKDMMLNTNYIELTDIKRISNLVTNKQKEDYLIEYNDIKVYNE